MTASSGPASSTCGAVSSPTATSSRRKARCIFPCSTRETCSDCTRSTRRASLPCWPASVTAIAIYASARRLGTAWGRHSSPPSWSRRRERCCGRPVRSPATVPRPRSPRSRCGPHSCTATSRAGGAPLLVGALFGGALATKPIVIAAIVPLAVWLLAPRRYAHVAAAGAAMFGAWLAAAVPWGLPRVWQQSIEYHRGAGPSYSHLSQLGKLITTLATRDAVLVAAVVLGIVAARRMRFARRAHATMPGFSASGSRSPRLVLVFEKAMFANHLAAMILPLALLAAVRPPPLHWLAIALVVLVPWDIANQRDILWPRHLTGVDAQVVAELRRLPPGAEAIADDPGLVWRAGLVDARTDERHHRHAHLPGRDHDSGRGRRRRVTAYVCGRDHARRLRHATAGSARRDQPRSATDSRTRTAGTESSGCDRARARTVGR